MIEQLLAEIEARANDATPGKCEFGLNSDGSMWMSLGDIRGPRYVNGNFGLGTNNARAFRAARTDITRLVAALRVAHAELNREWLAFGGWKTKQSLNKIEAALKGDDHA